MKLTALITHKRGDSFSYSGAITLPVGTWTGAAQLRKSYESDPVDTLTVAMSPPHDTVTTWAVLITATASEAALWPTGQVLCDIQFSNTESPPRVISTETFAIDVIKDVTRV